jgi:penicillin-binding protein-related factor A (putative recombinase)
MYKAELFPKIVDSQRAISVVNSSKRFSNIVEEARLSKEQFPVKILYHRSPQRTQRKNNKVFSRASRLCVLSVLCGNFFHFGRELLLSKTPA